VDTEFPGRDFQRILDIVHQLCGKEYGRQLTVPTVALRKLQLNLNQLIKIQKQKRLKIMKK
jgi:hypothetical protein